MKRYFLIYIILFFFIGCKKNNEQIKIENFENVIFKIPEDWKVLNLKNIDSKRKAYLSSDSDTIYVEYGLYNNPFDEKKIVVSDSLIYKKIKNVSESNVFFSEDQELDNSQGIFLDNYYYYDTINSYQAKIMLPKKKSKGQMGIYIKNIDKEGNSFSIYSSKPLKGKDSLAFLNIFKTIEITTKP